VGLGWLDELLLEPHPAASTARTTAQPIET